MQEQLQQKLQGQQKQGSYSQMAQWDLRPATLSCTAPYHADPTAETLVAEPALPQQICQQGS